AEYGGKTSLVIVATTRSGQGLTTPHGSVTASYGSFGTSNLGFNFGYGGKSWGNFISANGLNSGRFLDPPEFEVMHDKGNEENMFDRVDYQFSTTDSMHLNFGYSRSWFQNPNTFDEQFHDCNSGFVCNSGGQAVNPFNGALLGPTDQRSKIGTFNISPSFTHIINPATVLTFGAYGRRDQYNFYPSADPFADFSPDLQAQTIRQDRTLTNAGGRADISHSAGIHNWKAGALYQQTFLTEDDRLGTVDPGFLGLFNQLGPTGTPIAGTSCLDMAGNPTAPPCTLLNPSDLSRGGSTFRFYGHTDVKEAALYIQDAITKGALSLNLGIRGDIYNGFTRDAQPEPRLCVAYNVKRTNTVLRLSYARTMESPFNENLIISSTGCSNPVVSFMVPPPNISCVSGAIRPGWRNEFHSGFQQAFGKYLVIDGEYLWKYTHNGYDFGVVAATPIAFPIAWHNSKISGYTLRASVPSYRGFTALVVLSSVAARFFPPQAGGIPFLPAGNVFRIDHDEKFNQTTHFQYQPWKNGPWVSVNWRYDSGLVAGAIPCVAPTATCSASTSPADGGVATIPGSNPAVPLPHGQVAFVNNLTTLPLTADQEFQAGLTCNGVLAAPNPLGVALPTCSAAGLGSIYVQVPRSGTENDDHNPQRIAPRNLFDLSVGDDNLFRNEHHQWSLRLTAVNLTNKVALYNFFSTFSGTHYVTPRTLTGEIGFHF
ncbi:MAG: TonB-dependent receptor, partial [Acidobacteria bacterium]|nr:TonB-dependent receptor [Acidobacteriota bacterium]